MIDEAPSVFKPTCMCRIIMKHSKNVFYLVKYGTAVRMEANMKRIVLINTCGIY